jgi:hypothetical protein
VITATILRPVGLNDDGDPIDGDGNVIRDDAVSVGTVDIIVGGDSGSTRSVTQFGRGETVSTSGQIGYPISSGVTLQPGDILVVGGARYKIIGPTLWPDQHSLTGRPLRFRWVSYVAN